jgi:enoyl-CoA hydratase
MEFNNLILEIKDAVATITFNRPKALNALNEELLNEFATALAQLDQDEDIKVLVLTGAGEKSFVAGADITELARFNPLQGKLFGKLGQTAIGELQQLSKPVIAAVNGFALGGGCEIALACDFIYASENAMFGLPEINLGLIPGFGGTQRLARAVGPNLAKEMIFTGKMITAADALKIGLANQVSSPESLMEEVLKTARMIASKGKVALRAAKHAINNGLNVDLVSGCAIELDAFALCMASQDAKEGTAAFIEKRRANFTGTLQD